MNKMKSVSVPYCPDCREPMTATEDGLWGCSTENCFALCDPVRPSRQSRSKHVRVLVTPDTYRRLLQQVGGGSLSSYGNDAILEKLDKDELNQARLAIQRLEADENPA